MLLLSYGIVPAQDTDGWSLLLSNRFSDAERAFQRAFANNPKDARSALGLSMAFEAQRKSSDAHRWLLTAIRNSSDPYTILNASQLTERLRVGLRAGSDLLSLYSDVLA
ncbi:tetratricopeptide repeat protein, partial [Aphanothece microscopica]|uniref:tetratricopeptide repeat protein n=1 Tax=Aphanothece microscopica TaxID=1049561 RepID=UPI003CE4504E